MSSARHPQDDLSLAFDRLNRVVKATQELNSTLDLSELARIILRIVREEVGIERGTVFVMSPEHDHLTSLVAQDVDQAIKVRLGFGIAGSVAESGEIVDIPDAYRDERFDHSFDAKLGFRTKDIYCMPVRNPDRTIVGVLQLLNRNRELSEDDKNFLRDISVHVGLAIENAARHLRILEEERVAQRFNWPVRLFWLEVCANTDSFSAWSGCAVLFAWAVASSRDWSAHGKTAKTAVMHSGRRIGVF